MSSSNKNNSKATSEGENNKIEKEEKREKGGDGLGLLEEDDEFEEFPAEGER